MLRVKSLVHNGGISVCGLRELRAASDFERLLSSAANVLAHSATEASPPLEITQTQEATIFLTRTSSAAQQNRASQMATEKPRYSKRYQSMRGRSSSMAISKTPDGMQDPSMLKLFGLVKQKNFTELEVAHDNWIRSQIRSDMKKVNVHQYSRLMTQCVREVGPECALPVFELMLQAGVTLNVVPYTIVIRALMDLVKKESDRKFWMEVLHFAQPIFALGPHKLREEVMSEERTHPGGQHTEEVAKSEAWASKAVELLREMRRKGIRPNELTYKPIMSWLPVKGRDAQFQELKKYMEEDRVAFRGVFKYYEIRLTLRVGDINKAERLYMDAKNEDEDVASSLDAYFLSTFAQGDRVGELVELLPKVLLTITSIGSIITAFQCLGKHGQHEAALRCFPMLKRKGRSMVLPSHCFTAYILGHARGKKLDDGLRAMRDIEEKCKLSAPAEVFNILIDFCCQQGEVSRGLDLLDEIQQRGLELSPFAFNPFIRDFAGWNMHEEAFEMKAAMSRLGVQPSVVTYGTLIKACVKVGNMEKAYGLLAEMKELGVQPNSHCFNPLIMGFGIQERLDRALAVQKEMEELGINPDVHTYNLLILACSQVKNEGKAVELFEEMTKTGIQPTKFVYSSMATVFAKCGNLDRSIKMVREIERRGEDVGIDAKSAILAGLSLAGRLNEALTLYETIKKQGVLPLAYSVSALLVAVGKARDLDCMRKIFDECRSDEQWIKLSHRQRTEHLNVRCINVVLSCIRSNKLDQAIEFLRKVREERIADESVLFDKIFLHISIGGRDENEMCWLDVEDGFAVVKAMREMGLQPSRMAFEALLDGCAAMNDSDLARRVVGEMEREGLALNILTMTRLFRAYVAAEDEEWALELLDQMQAYDLQDGDVRTMIYQTLRPHYAAAADSPEAAQAPETLPRVRQRVDDLFAIHFVRKMFED